jgi:hypothetical protein
MRLGRCLPSFLFNRWMDGWMDRRSGSSFHAGTSVMMALQVRGGGGKMGGRSLTLGAYMKS